MFRFVKQFLTFGELPVWKTISRSLPSITSRSGSIGRRLVKLGVLEQPQRISYWTVDGRNNIPPRRKWLQTAQVPPLNPMVTFLPSTIIGTFRAPSECFNMALSFSGCPMTLIYSTSSPFSRKASRAAMVCGQVSFPKIKVFPAIANLPLQWWVERVKNHIILINYANRYVSLLTGKQLLVNEYSLTN